MDAAGAGVVPEHGHCLDQVSHGLRTFRIAISNSACQGGLETCELLLVAGEHGRMQGDGLGGRSRLRELGCDFFAFAVQECRLRTKNGWISLPLRDGVNETVNLTV